MTSSANVARETSEVLASPGKMMRMPQIRIDDMIDMDMEVS